MQKTVTCSSKALSNPGATVVKSATNVFCGFSGEVTMVPLPTSQHGLEGKPGFVGTGFRGPCSGTAQWQQTRAGAGSALLSAASAGRTQHQPGGSASTKAEASTKYREKTLIRSLYA